MSGQTAVVIGSTGMIGELVVRHLIDDPAFTNIRLLVRRPVDVAHPKVDVMIVDFADLADLEQKLGHGDSIFCCVGTTQSKVKGDKAAYRRVDFDLPVNTARAGLQNGFSKFLLVSAIGADAAAGNYYLKLKGETEDALKKIGYPSLHIFQPSLLMGSRKEFRFTEKIAQAVMPVASVFLAGKLKKYRAIKGDDVAAAMVNAARSDTGGIHVYTYEDIITTARQKA